MDEKTRFIDLLVNIKDLINNFLENNQNTFKISNPVSRSISIVKTNELTDFSRKKTAVSRKIFPQKMENVTFKKSRIQPKKVEDYANGDRNLTDLQKEKLLKKEWCVYYSVKNQDTGRFVPVRVYKSINSIHNFDLRLEEAVLCRDSINYTLAQRLTESPESSILSCEKSIEKYLERKRTILKGRSTGRYATSMNIFKEFLEKENLLHLPLSYVKKAHIEKLLDQIKDEGNSSRWVNNVRGDISTLFNFWIRKLDDEEGEGIIRKNPCANIDKLPVADSELYTPPTDEEIRKIIPHLFQNCPQLLKVLKLIYYCCLRPADIVALTPERIDLKNGYLIPSSTTKNKKLKPVAIPNDFLEEMKFWGIDQLEPGTYLFSHGLEPGNNLLLTNGVSKFWIKHVIKELGINKKLYSFKHLANARLRDAGATPFEMQHHNRHHSVTQTEIYTSKLRPAESKLIRESYPNL